MLETFQKVTKLLVFSDDDVWRQCFRAFDSSRFSAVFLENADGAFVDVLLLHPDAIFVDKSFFIKKGLSFFVSLIQSAGTIPVIFLSDEDDLTISRWIMEQGGYIISAFPAPEFIIRKLDDILRAFPLKQEKMPDTADMSPFAAYIGETEKIRALKFKAARFAQGSLPILITGETGTGKTYLAQSIHNASPRAAKPYRQDSMAEIQDNLAESRLFGSVRHAYTDASDSQGLFGEADGGTVFLDEIGEASLALQSKLLRVLGQNRIQKVGSTREIVVDVRLITATNRNLIYAVEEGRFRQDLYYRIAPLTLEIPPLREHMEDIPLLVGTFLKDGRKQLSRGALEKLLSHTWPGNIRELDLCIKGVLQTCTNDIITESDIFFPPPAIPRLRQ